MEPDDGANPFPVDGMRLDAETGVLLGPVSRGLTYAGDDPGAGMALNRSRIHGPHLLAEGSPLRRDFDQLAPPALEHRIMLNYAAHSDNVDTARIVEQVVKAVRPTRL